MRIPSSTIILSAFALVALAAMTNVACSRVEDVDSGSSEVNASAYGGHHYGSVGEGYGAYATDLAKDSSEF